MSSYRVRVIRDLPRNRDIYRNLTGIMHVRIMAESYLHVGQGLREQMVTLDSRLIDELQRRITSREKINIRDLLRDLSRYVEIERVAVPFSRVSGAIVIPGGTIKGNIRSRLELSFKAKEGAVRACFIAASPAIRSPAPPGSHGWRHQRIWISAVYEDRGPPCNLTSDNVVCLLCDIFGTAGLKSLIDFSDFRLHEENVEEFDTKYRMKLEAVKPGSSFEGHIYFRSLKPEELGLILFGMGIRNGSLSEPVLLGRFKYHKFLDSGKFGRIRYKIESIVLSTYSEPLRIGGKELHPGEPIQGDLLEEVVNGLIQETTATFNGELEFIDEVGIVERLQ